MNRRSTLLRFAVQVTCVLALAVPAFSAPRPAFFSAGPSGARTPRAAAERPLSLAPASAVSRSARAAFGAQPPAQAAAPANFKITYKNCNLTVGTNPTTATVTVTNAAAALIKIQKLKKAPANPAPKPGVAYILDSTGIATFSVDGDVLKFSSAANITLLQATGSLFSVATTGAYIQTIEADLVGKVKQLATARTDSANEVFSTAIYAGSSTPGTLRPGAPVLAATLTGVGLFEVVAQEQTLSANLASKKWRNAFHQKDLSLANIPFAGDNVIAVGDVFEIRTMGGAIVPSAIVAAAPVDGGSLLWGSGILFTGAAGPTVYDGTVWPDLIDSRATNLDVISTGGDVRANTVVADGEISLFDAYLVIYRVGGGVTYSGGALGLDPATTTATMHVVSGADLSLSAADIDDVFGSVSVRGDFFAGGDTQFGTLLSASLVLVGTDDPGIYPADPTITGNGWSKQAIQFIGGDHSGFVEHYP